jgi:hypothetical protein
MRYALVAVMVAAGCKHSGGGSSPDNPPPPVHPDESTLSLVMVDPVKIGISSVVSNPGHIYTYTISGEVFNLSNEVMSNLFVRLNVQYSWDCRFEVNWIEDPTECFEVDVLAPGESIKFTRTIEDYRRDGYCYILVLDLNFNAKWKSDGTKVYSNSAPDEAIPEPAKPPLYTVHLINSSNGCSW